MTVENNKNRKSILPKQNRYLPIILWLFPLLLLNLGWYVFTDIDYRSKENEWIEQSKQDAEFLSASSDFNYWVGKISGRFLEDLKSGAETFSEINQKERLKNYINSRANDKFKAPFPEHTLFVFKLSDQTKKTELFYSNTENIVSRTALAKSFEYLVRVNSRDTSYSKEAEKSGATITNNFLGGESDPSVMAETQRGKLSYSIYQYKPHYFIWDYFNNKKSGDLYGFFLLIENTKKIDIAGRLIALKNFRNSQDSKEKQSYGAFIPLFAGYGGVVASEEFSKMPEYKTVVRKWVPNNIKELYDWQFKDVSKIFDNTRIGNYQAFFHLTNGQSHAAVLLKPLLDKSKMPFWLYLLDIFIISFIILLLVRGFLLGKWPYLSFKIRFVLTYFLAACMPLGLLIIASYGYISEYKHSAIFNDQSQLKLCINQFETRKTQNQEEYKTAFLEIKNDSIFQECINRLDKANKEEPKTFPPEAKAVLNRVLEILNKNSRELPIICITILDERGNYFSNFGNKSCQTYKICNGDEFVDSGKLFSDKEFPKEELKNKITNEKSIEVVLYSFLEPMRNAILEAAPNTKKWNKDFVPSLIQEIAIGGFKNARGNGGSLTDELNNHRNLAISRLVGDKVVSSIYDNILIEGIPRFTIYMQWDVSDLDKKSFNASRDYFALKEPNFVFTSYETTPLGVKPWLDSGRHSREMAKKCLELANQAYSRKNYASSIDDERTIIAVPSLKYKDKIIVGCVSHHYLELPIFKRWVICISVIVFSLLTLLICLYFSFKIFIKPIGKLKQALDKVADGNLDLEIISSSKDEFGIMCHEFSDMTRELSERNKLATLLSDHAVEALSKKEDNNGVISDVETFKGTALVTDIRNFTGMCEKNTPEQITDLLNKHFASMTRIFTANGGRIYKYIGDAIEVVFSDNDDFDKSSVERAFTAAVEMLNTLNELNFERRKNNLFEYKIGVGLCYSNMSSGSIGSLETRLDYAILGDALKNAAKLEGFSKLNPELPIVVDGNFISLFRKRFENISFSIVKSEDGLEGYKIQNYNLDNLLNLIGISKKTNSSDLNSVNKKNLIESKDKSQIEHFEIKESIYFWEKFAAGFIFIIILIWVLAAGLYYVDNSERASKKLESIANSQRIFEQMRCDNYGKVAFDSKCRKYAKSVQNVINNLGPDDTLSDEIITNALKDCYDSDKSIAGLDFNIIFIKNDNYVDYNNLLNNRSEFLNKIPVYPIVNIGFSEEEAKKICETYKISFVNNLINKLEREIELKTNLKLKDIDKDNFENIKNDLLDSMKNNWGEPSKAVFGDKITLYLLKNVLNNGSIESETRGKASFLFNLSYYYKKELIGYLLISMPSDKAFNTIPFILTSFFKNDEKVVLKSKDTPVCYFSENIPEYIKEKINHINVEKKGLINDVKETAVKEYLNSLSDIVSESTIKINNVSYDIFSFELNNKENNLRLLKYLLVCIFGCFLIYVFWNIINGNSKINYSIPAKLWLTLLIVAVIPVIMVFFVFSLFLNENLSVRISQKRGEMQRFMGLFESKKDFSHPLIWNEILNNNTSKDLNGYIHTLNDKTKSDDVRKNALNDLRKHFITLKENSYKKARSIDFSKDILCSHISDISLSGKEGWSFCSADDPKDDSIEDKKLDLAFFEEKRNNKKSIKNVTYIDEDVKSQEYFFTFMLKMIVKFLLLRQSENVNSNTSLDNTTNEIALETSLESVKAFFGEDTFIKISHGINIPIIFDIGFGKFGIMISSLPNFKNPDVVLVWLINIDTFEYLKRVTDKVDTDIKIFIVESFRYGFVADDTDNNNYRIPLGEYTSWLSSSYLPISTVLEMENGRNLVECAPALTQINALLVLLSPEDAIIKDVDKMAYGFYGLLAVSLLIIIVITKNIADDIINPVNALIFGIKEVNKENFSFRINSDRNDELGTLCQSFDKMTKGLDEKRMMSHMLSRTARMVTLEEGTMTSGKTNAVLLYIGIPDFSKVMKNLGDYEVFELLKKHTAVLAGIIMDEGGEVDKIIGEKMLAVFRVNKNASKTALAAYKAAKQMLELERANKLSFSISIGLNYGNVINGFLGVGNKRDFTVIGDPVNVAARIESLAESLEHSRCVISETFYKLITGSVKVRAYGEVELKGKSQPMKVYQLS